MSDTDQPLHLMLDETTGDRVLIYETGKGVRLELQHKDDTFWLTQEQMAELFGIDRSGVARHLQNIYSEAELDEDATCAKNARVVANGKTYEVNHYNLDAVISVGYRVGSKQGTLFRKWATGVLVQLATKGFVVDVTRLKNPAEHDHIAELREIIRDIRASEANLYAELRDICRLCQDYDPQSEAARTFYSHMQAKLFHAVVSETPSELIAERAERGFAEHGLENVVRRTHPQEGCIDG